MPSIDFTQQQFISIGSALVCSVIGSVHDVRERRIPNWLTGPAIIAGLLLHGTSGGWRGLADSALSGLVAGGLSLAFYIAGGLGAGDVKLMTAVGCLVGFSPLRPVLIATAISGALVGAAFSFYHGRLRETLSNVNALVEHHRRNGFKPHPELNLENPGTLRLPFALPIAAGCLFALCMAVWQAHS
jgi:prepilin peptidase CpaA